jgi:hypothetical protein
VRPLDRLPAAVTRPYRFRQRYPPQPTVSVPSTSPLLLWNASHPPRPYSRPLPQSSEPVAPRW